MSEQKPVDSNPTPPAGGDREWPDDRRRRMRRGPMHGLFWGMLLILLGVLFFLNVRDVISDDRWWQYFLIGLGAIFILDALVHYASKISYGIYGRMIAGVVLIVIGAGFVGGWMNNWDNWWPIILIAVGVAILLGYIVRRSR